MLRRSGDRDTVVSKVRELRMLMAGGVSAEPAESKRRRYRKSLSMLELERPDERLVELLRYELEALEVRRPPGPVTAMRPGSATAT
jgi:hypothetical protein